MAETIFGCGSPITSTPRSTFPSSVTSLSPGIAQGCCGGGAGAVGGSCGGNGGGGSVGCSGGGGGGGGANAGVKNVIYASGGTATAVIYGNGGGGAGGGGGGGGEQSGGGEGETGEENKADDKADCRTEQAIGKKMDQSRSLSCFPLSNLSDSDSEDISMLLIGGVRCWLFSHFIRKNLALASSNPKPKPKPYLLFEHKKVCMRCAA